MPNYYKDRYNRFIDEAAGIYRQLTGSYMDIYENRLLDQGTEAIEIGKMQFVRVLQYRRTESIQTDFSLISDAMRANLRYCFGLGAAFGYFIVSKGRETDIYLAIEGASTDKLAGNISAVIPDCAFKKGFIPSEMLRRLSSNGGIINGRIKCGTAVVDKIMSAMSDLDGIVALLAVPMEPAEVSGFVGGLSLCKQISDDLMDGNAGYNSKNWKAYDFIPEISALLEKSLEYYGNCAEEYWKYCIWFGCESGRNLKQLGNAVKAALNGNNTDGTDKMRCYYTASNPLQTGTASLPLADYSGSCCEIKDILRKPSLITYISTSDLASLIQFPVNSFRGFSVIEYEKDKNSRDLFDTDYNKRAGRLISLGNDINSGIGFSLRVNDIAEHVLITGATGAGKTNTVMKLAKGIYEANIPLLIIEPSKKDYWHLASEMKALKIYSFGKDAEPLRINPFIPEEGTIIVNHVDSLIRAFSGAFEMEPPTRFALDGLLKYTYGKFGWKMNETAYYSGKKFPKLDDMVSFLPEYINTSLPYGNEVKANVYGSLLNRLSSLTSGVTGESAKSDNPISGRELCSGTVLIELDDLSVETKPFMAMLIMIKVEQYLRQGNASSFLKNVIVLEEAHNIFANVSGHAAVTTKKLASDLFSNMLSQIREYGTGIIIADQGASQINDTAVSNTKIKIIHRIVDGKDMDKVSFALNLSEIQKREFPFLGTGEAIVSVGGSRAVSKIKVCSARCNDIINTACMFCSKRRFCGMFNSAAGPLPVNRKAMYSNEIYRVRFEPETLKCVLDSIAARLGWPDENKLCLLGHLLMDDSVRCGEREKRRIIMTYMEA